MTFTLIPPKNPPKVVQNWKADTKPLAASLFLGQGWPSVNADIFVRHLCLFNQPIQDPIAVQRLSLSYTRVCVVNADYDWKQHGFGIPWFFFCFFFFASNIFFWLKTEFKPYFSVFCVKIVCAYCARMCLINQKVMGHQLTLRSQNSFPNINSNADVHVIPSNWAW